MKRSIRVFPFYILIGLFFLLGEGRVRADERILNFDSQITVNQDGSMVVTETILVRSEGSSIKHGIYRDFPKKYTDTWGNHYSVGFDVTNVRRDGHGEEFHYGNISNGVRVYIGSKNYLLPPKEYTYTLTYRTNRQLGYFKDHDELYWNVTGNGWDFPIDTAKATVILPSSIPHDQIHLVGFTGPIGAKGKKFISQVNPDGLINFQTTMGLHPREGLTIVASWPKGFFTEPTSQEKILYLLKDNRELTIALVGFIGVLIYYLLAWLAVGKDPAKGTIIPLYQAPDDLSPAAMRFISQMGFDNKTISSAMLSLAVKGWIKIMQEGEKYTLIPQRDAKGTLSPEEKVIYTKLFDGTYGSLTLENLNHTKISEALLEFQKTLKIFYEKNYFISNRKYFVVGLLLSLIAPIVIAVSGPAQSMFIIPFMSFWLSIWTIGVLALVLKALSNWKNVFMPQPDQGVTWISNLGGAVFFTLISLPFLGGEFFGLFILSKALPISAIAILFLTMSSHILFFHLLKAPTIIGRQVMDKIDGFKMYLKATEINSYQGMSLPEKTPQLFERYLPYAIALGVESLWVAQFTQVLANASAYSPGWYSGPNLNHLGTPGFYSSLGNSFSSAITSSSTAPGSGSGGGGSSGGGGGGGGGGGW